MVCVIVMLCSVLWAWLFGGINLWNCHFGPSSSSFGTFYLGKTGTNVRLYCILCFKGLKLLLKNHNGTRFKLIIIKYSEGLTFTNNPPFSFKPDSPRLAPLQPHTLCMIGVLSPLIWSSVVERFIQSDLVTSGLLFQGSSWLLCVATSHSLSTF